MFIYQYLEINNHAALSHALKNYIETKTDVLQQKIPWKFLNHVSLLDSIPELEIFFMEKKLKIIMAAAVYRKPYSQGGIHIDTSKFCRVLWPIVNCKGSKTKFYKFDIDKFQPGSGIDGDRNLSLISGSTLEYLDEFELILPVIFNPKIPHGVYCNPVLNQPRVSVTFGFDRDPKDVFVLERPGDSNLRL